VTHGDHWWAEKGLRPLGSNCDLGSEMPPKKEQTTFAAGVCSIDAKQRLGDKRTPEAAHIPSSGLEEYMTYRRKAAGCDLQGGALGE